MDVVYSDVVEEMVRKMPTLSECGARFWLLMRGVDFNVVRDLGWIECGGGSESWFGVGKEM